MDSIALRRQSSERVASPSDIPIEDEEYGEDFDLSVSSHKRKQSGIPIAAAEAAMFNRSSHSGSGSALEQIADDEEQVVPDSCNGKRKSLSRNVSFSDAAAYALGKSKSTPPRVSPMSSPMSVDLGEAFDQENRSFYSYASSYKLLSTRNMLILAFITLAALFMTMHTPSTPDPGYDVSRPVEDDAHNEDGEDHFEGVGSSLESYTEVNKVRVYKSLDRMEEMKSGGPRPADRALGGMHSFSNVCLTKNMDAMRYEHDPTTSLRGLIYFTRDQEENLRRCVPCSNSQSMDSWDGSYEDEKVVNHKCGMNGLHAMYATSAGDWSDCIMKEDNFQLMKKNGQTQSPTDVTTVHVFQEPTFLLQFNALDVEDALFNMLMTFLPFYHEYQSSGEFPFESVISHSVEGCLSHSHHPFCELLHQMNAFGRAQEIPWENDKNTLYCYKTLYYNQVGYNRHLEHEGHVTKQTFGNLRNTLFMAFGLPRKRTVEGREKDEKIEGEDLLGTKIILYDKKSRDETYWTDMEAVITQAKTLEKYRDITFAVVEDFEDLSVAQQARTFNEADAVVMVHGQHMANAIYAVDGTSFVGVGCSDTVPLVGNPRFMELMDSNYRYVTKCIGDNGGESEACIVCQDDKHFALTLPVFENIIDGVMSDLKK